MWAAPGDEIKSPSNVVSGKWYYLKGTYNSGGEDIPIYYSIPNGEDKSGGKPSGDDAAQTNIANATPVLFTQVTDGWTITSPNGYYIRPHSSNGQTYLMASEYVLTLENGTTKEGENKGIKIGSYTTSGSKPKTYYLQANKTATRIGGYTNSQWDLTLIEASAPATFAAGKTMISFSYAKLALDFTDANRPAGLKAYKVSAADATSVTLTEVTTTVAKNTGLILTGTAGTTYDIPFVDSGTDISATNLLVATDGTSTVSDAAVLKDGKFHPLNSGVIAAGKAYLPYANITGGDPFAGGAPALDIVFGGTTGIESVKGAEFMTNGEFYNLAGQRVAQPTKGLYIVNGKKVIIK